MTNVVVIITLIDARRLRRQRIFGSIDVLYLIHYIRFAQQVKNIIFTLSTEEKTSKNRNRVRQNEKRLATRRYKTTSKSEITNYLH